MKTVENFLAGVIGGMLICMLVFAFTSCKTSGYGCKGKESWGRMVKRINSPN